jgi:hypothetical protein
MLAVSLCQPFIQLSYQNSLMRKLLYLLPLALVAACSNNLVKNGGAETVPFNEWTTVSGKWTQRGKTPSPQEGKFYFFPSVAAHAELFQDIDVSSYKLLTDVGLMKVQYKSYLRAFPQQPADQSYEIVEFRDANGNTIDSFTTAHYDSTNAWIAIDHQQALPKGVRIVRVRLLSDRFNGSNNDGYHDGLQFTLSISWWIYLIILAPLVLGLWLRKKSKIRKNTLP